MSDPPTPLSKDKKRRFKSITSPCEYVEDYRPGGLHPIHLGDLLRDGQYKIIRKLGEGSYSTVWLARDLRGDTYVALKILVSELLEPISEAEIWNRLTQAGATGCSLHVPQILDEFKIHGPNGVHTCLVFEPMGPSVNHMLMELPQFKPRMIWMKVRYPFWMAKRILKQALEGLAFLHAAGVAHGDVQPGNMLFCLKDINSEPEEALRQREDADDRSISPPVQRLDGREDRWAPRYLCVAKPLALFTNYGEDFRIKLSDLGGAYLFTDPPATLLTPRGLRAPEFVVTETIDTSLDIWAFGCLVFELVTGQQLFCVPYSEFEDDDHLLQLHNILGPLPDELFRQWKNSSLYFSPEGEIFNLELGKVTKDEDAKDEGQEGGGEESEADSEDWEIVPMEDTFDNAQPELEIHEADEVKALVRRILQYDSSKRPTAEELLKDPFFQ